MRFRGYRTARLARVALFGLLSAIAFALAAAGPAAAQDSERIESFTVDARISEDGVIAVTETIEYYFNQPRRGILREIVNRQPVSDTHDREYPITDIEVSSPSGAPVDVTVSERRNVTIIRIGDPDRTIEGRHTYVLTYRLHGHLNTQDNHDELYWQATGTKWRVPIDEATVRVRAPSEITRVRCFAGSSRSTNECELASIADDGAAVFEQRELRAYAGLTVVVAVEQGAIDVPPPMLKRTALMRPRTLTLGVAAGWAGLLVVSALGFVGAGAVRFTRDGEYVGLPLGLAPAHGETGAERLVPLTGRAEPPVAFTPPRGVPAAMIGLIMTKRVRPLAISTMIVDLAVRGHLRITEFTRPGSRKPDWTLRRLEPPPGARMARYEQTLVSMIFGGKNTMQLSKVAGVPLAKTVRMRMATEAAQARWFRTGRLGHWLLSVHVPLWLKVVIAYGVLSIPLVFAMSLGNLTFTGPPAMLLLAGTAVGALIVVLALRSYPPRTALGRAVWAQAVGFRRYLATAEAAQLRTEEQADVFSRYLPYAMIFGLTDRWATVLSQLGRPVPTSWYSGPASGNPALMASAIAGFGAASAVAVGRSLSGSGISGSSAGGGSGFSGGGSTGGGSGGGGGGSW